MKHLNGHVLVGAPYSEARRDTATHVCADCLEADPRDNRYEALTIGHLPIVHGGSCDVCEREGVNVGIVKANKNTGAVT